MTRDELLELLTVERFAPGPTSRVSPDLYPGPRLQPLPIDDEVTIRRRRRELIYAAERYVDPDTARRATRARARARRNAARQNRSA